MGKNNLPDIQTPADSVRTLNSGREPFKEKLKRYGKIYLIINPNLKAQLNAFLTARDFSGSSWHW